MRLRLLLALTLNASGWAGEEESIASGFYVAWRGGDVAAQLDLATKPMDEVAYTLVADALLAGGEWAAATALAELRAGAADGEGLARLVKAAKLGIRAAPDQLAALERARTEARNANADACRQALRETGTIPADTVAWVQEAGITALLEGLEGRTDLERSSWRAAGDRAVAVGWFAFALQAREREHAAALKSGDRQAVREAVDGRVEVATRLGRVEAQLNAHLARFHLQREERRHAEARAEIERAITFAGALGRRLLVAQLTVTLANVFHEEGMPRRARKFYEEAIPLLVKEGAESDAATARFNLALVLADLAEYGRAHALLEDLLVSPRSADSAFRAELLAKRANVLSRMGAIESAEAAYRAALAAAVSPDRRDLLLVGLGEVQILRWDLDDAAACFREVLSRDPSAPEALQGMAGVDGLRGDEDAALAGFDRARPVLDRQGRKGEAGRLLLRRAAYLRAWGRVREALASAREALGLLIEVKDEGNAAAARAVIASLLVLSGDLVEGAKWFESAAALNHHLLNSAAAGSAYLRTGLCLRALAKREDAEACLEKARLHAGRLEDNGLRAAILCGFALLDLDQGRLAEAVAKAREAETLAQTARDLQRAATAVALRARLEPSADGALSRQALGLEDALRMAAGEQESFLDGESSADAPGVAIGILIAASADDESAKAAAALPFLERSRARSIEVALRGRDSILAATLPAPLLEPCRRVLGRWFEARATEHDELEAAGAFDAFVERLRAQAPLPAAVAFPEAPTLDEVRALLREDEALLLMIDDWSVRGALAITREGALLRGYEIEFPLAPFEDLLRGKKRLVVAPDGLFASLPFETARRAEGSVFDGFQVSYTASASAFRRMRARREGGGEGLFVTTGLATPRFPRHAAGLAALPRERVRVWLCDWPGRIQTLFPKATHLDAPGGRITPTALLRCRLDAGLALFPRTALSGADLRARGEGLGGFGEALALAGVERAVFCVLDQEPPRELVDRFLDNLVERKMAPGAALDEAKRWARGQDGWQNPTFWAGLVYYGVDD
ncbi:MAG: hypothetical protein ACT4PV_13250 [Planctomycetaceae bacterium]